MSDTAQRAARLAEEKMSPSPEGVLILDRKAPLESARKFIEEKYTDIEESQTAQPSRTLHHHNGQFYAWNGQCYPPAQDSEIRAAIYEFLDNAGSADGGPFQPNTQRVNQVVDALKAAANLPEVYKAPCWLEQTPDLPPDEILAFSNGLLHLSDRVLIPSTPKFFSHHAVDYPYNPDAPTPKAWMKFLDDLWGDDQPSIDTLQEIFGYLLTADLGQHKMFMLVGPKRSGKGTIGRVITGMLGQNNVCAPTLASLNSNFGLAPLVHKLVAIISDARLGGRADQQAIAERLLSISGADFQTVDRKYQETWGGTLPVRFLMLTNELPRIADASGALASRFIILKLTESFYGREDLSLISRLLDELPSILNWSIAGWDRLRKREHFVPPKSGIEAMEQLEDLSSPISAFLRDCCVTDEPGAEIEIKALYDAWKGWCTEQGRDRPGTLQLFGRDLRAAVPHLKIRQYREGDDRVRAYQGVKLR